MSADQTEALRSAIAGAVQAYLANEEAYSDATQVQINVATMEAELADPDQDLPGYDYFDVMEFVRMGADGAWIEDPEAIADAAAQYAVE